MIEPWSPYATPPSVVFEGGPVEPGSVIGLALSGTTEEGPTWAPAFDSIGTIDLSVLPDEQGTLIRGGGAMPRSPPGPGRRTSSTFESLSSSTL